jgi:hypothetical protein
MVIESILMQNQSSVSILSFVLNKSLSWSKNMRISNRRSEAVCQRRTDNTMAKRKSTMIYKSIHRKLEFEQRESHKSRNEPVHRHGKQFCYTIDTRRVTLDTNFRTMWIVMMHIRWFPLRMGKDCGVR